MSSEKKRFRVAHCSFCVAPAMSSHVGSSEQQRLGAAAAYRFSKGRKRRSWWRAKPEEEREEIRGRQHKRWQSQDRVVK